MEGNYYTARRQVQEYLRAVNHRAHNDNYLLTPDKNQKTSRPSHFWSIKESLDMPCVNLGTLAQDPVFFLGK